MKKFIAFPFAVVGLTIEAVSILMLRVGCAISDTADWIEQ